MFQNVKIEIMKECLFLEYPACGTCRKARKWLDEHGVCYADRHIVDDRPTIDELREWGVRGGLPLRIDKVNQVLALFGYEVGAVPAGKEHSV